MLEGLSKYWGFYLVAIPSASGVGVRDLQNALDHVSEHLEWVSDLGRVNIGERAAQDKVNSWIASKHFREVLAAHVVVFLAVYNSLRSSSTGHCKRSTNAPAR